MAATASSSRDDSGRRVRACRRVLVARRDDVGGDAARGAQPVPGARRGDRRRGRPRPTCPRPRARSRGGRCAARHRPHGPRPRAHGPRHRADQCRRAAGRLARPAVRSRLGYGRAPRTDGPGRPDHHLRRLQAEPAAASGRGVRRARGRDRPRHPARRGRARHRDVPPRGRRRARALPAADPPTPTRAATAICSSSPARSARPARRRSRPARRSGAASGCARSRRRGSQQPIVAATHARAHDGAAGRDGRRTRSRSRRRAAILELAGRAATRSRSARASRSTPRRRTLVAGARRRGASSHGRGRRRAERARRSSRRARPAPPAPRVLDPASRRDGADARHDGRRGPGAIASRRRGTSRDGIALHLALKGAGTVVAAPDGRVFINPTGNPGHGHRRLGRRAHRDDRRLPGARARSARGALTAACYLHGLAGDLAAAERGEEGLIAGDIVEAIAAAMTPPDAAPRDEGRRRASSPRARRRRGRSASDSAARLGAGRRGGVHRRARRGEDLLHPGAGAGARRHVRGDEPDLRARQPVPRPPARLPPRCLPHRRASPSCVDIGVEEMLHGDGVTVVEWADKLLPLLPARTITVADHRPRRRAAPDHDHRLKRRRRRCIGLVTLTVLRPA